MKALQRHNGTPLRIVAVSAPVPNAADLASWLGTADNPGCHHTFGERLRPVPLRRLVLGYPCAVGTSDFRFDMSLSYKLPLVIENYSEGKPTIVFCSTRKGVLQTAGVVAGNCSSLVRDVRTRDRLLCAAATLRDAKLRDVVPRGVGFHHAGLCPEDRGAVEALFREGGLPVLVSTSTLAMGVNLPAHLVVVKSTSTYALGGTGLYPDLVVDQMLGRAGRPQFDVSGTAVIMTKLSLKPRYEQLVQGTQAMESSLHRSLVEHLNAEIVLRTVRDLAGCVTWAKSTFFYVRLRKNPAHYGQPRGLGEQGAQDKLHELCRESVTALVRASLATLDADSGCLEPTGAGRLMARYCISLDTMERFSQLPARLSLETLVATLSGCAEYADVQLRTSEKAALNKLNGTKRAPGIRSQQVDLLSSQHIYALGPGVSAVLLEFLLLRTECGFGALLQAVVLHKCIQARLWEDSLHVARQIDKIGAATRIAFALKTSMPPHLYSYSESTRQAGHCDLRKSSAKRPCSEKPHIHLETDMTGVPANVVSNSWYELSCLGQATY
ncbi:probable ATP-dependent DNA helicase HFM1 [Ixodes scapularis]|uniref:probable ATP-dependent DNA helicase HFM1 n=1 Tax=Ixodes scapularis TaxID=6945 RepID=UPI001C380E2D|nr:probable ATP-dependent DNA helicase HFM1 [Ixodes scapularis]